MTVRLLALTGCMVLACATAGRDPSNNNNDAPHVDASDGPALGIDGNNCTMQPCDILPQCGCVSTTQACDIDGSDLMGSACRTVVSSAKDEGGTCGNLSQCKGGLVCLGGFCKKYCSASADCGQPRGQCVIDIKDAATQMIIPGIPPVCSSGCDPSNVASGTQCAPGAKCGLFVQTHNGVMSNIVDCTLAGGGTQGANCETGTTNVGDDTLCAVNHICTTPDSLTFTCRKVCNKTANTGCTGSLVCSSLATPFTVGGTEYGICQ